MEVCCPQQFHLIRIKREDILNMIPNEFSSKKRLLFGILLKL